MRGGCLGGGLLVRYDDAVAAGREGAEPKASDLIRGMH